MNAATEADDSFPALKAQVKRSFEQWMTKYQMRLLKDKVKGN